MGKISRFLSLTVNISKTVADKAKVTINDLKSLSHMGLTPRSMTVDDLIGSVALLVARRTNNQPTMGRLRVRGLLK